LKDENSKTSELEAVQQIYEEEISELKVSKQAQE
jgi:hypothetical protein